MAIDLHRPVRRYCVLSRAVRRQSSEVVFELLERRLSCSATPAMPIDGAVVIGEIGTFGPGPVSHLPSAEGLAVTSRFPVILDHRENYAGTIATFTDAEAGGMSDYSATIDWGDGSPLETGVITRDPVTGEFSVGGTHTYIFGTYYPRVTVMDLRGAGIGEDPGRATGVSPMLSVFPPPVAGTAYPVNVVGGWTFRTTVATYVGLDTSLLSRYGARISWGDGQYDTGELVVNSDGSVSVIGRHAYAAPGFYDVSVTLAESGAAGARDGASVSRSRATVADGTVAGTGTGSVAQSGVPFRGNLVYFKYLSNAHPDPASLRAEVFLRDSGDGTNVPGRIVPADGGFYVAVDHVFPGEDIVSFEVRVYDDALPASASVDHLTGLFRGSIVVTPHIHFSQEPAFSATAGVPGRFLVGHVVSEDVGHLWNTTLAAMINWGDNSEASAGELVPTGDGGFDVYGTHTYAITGRSNDFRPSLTVTETRTPAAPGLPPGTLTTSAGSFATANVSAGSFPGFFLFRAYYISTSGRVDAEAFTGTDVTDDDFTAFATWGDGVVTPASITRTGDHLHIYAERSDLAPGQYNVTLTVRAGAYEQSVDAAVNVAEPYDPSKYLLNATVHTVPAQVYRGTHFHGVVATFTLNDVDPSASPEEFSAWLQSPWPLGNVVTTIVGNGDGSFSVVADFDAIGLSGESYFIPSVHISRGQRSTVADWSLSVTADPTLPDVQAKSLHFRQRQAFTTTVASFTAPAAGGSVATPGRFSAVIEWGDGTTSAGVITQNWDGSFDISGTHTYHNKYGYVALRVALTDSVTGRTVFTQPTLSLDHDPVEVSPGTPDVSTEGDGVVSGTLATFIDEDGPSSDPTRYRVYYAALIDWGDGDVSEGLVSVEPDGTYAVRSSHAYAASGDFDISVLVRRNMRYVPIVDVLYGRYVVSFAALDNSVGDQLKDFSVRLRVSVRRGDSSATTPTEPTETVTAPSPATPIVEAGVDRPHGHSRFRSVSPRPAVAAAAGRTPFSFLPVGDTASGFVLDDTSDTSVLDRADAGADSLLN